MLSRFTLRRKLVGLCQVPSTIFCIYTFVTFRNIYLPIVLHIVTMKPVQRLNKDSLAILEEYDKDADRAIFLMQIKLKDLQRQVKPLHFVTGSDTQALHNVTNLTTPSQFDDKYWKKLSETVDSCIERAKRY
jgi:hypothetical protein